MAQVPVHRSSQLVIGDVDVLRDGAPDRLRDLGGHSVHVLEQGVSCPRDGSPFRRQRHADILPHDAIVRRVLADLLAIGSSGYGAHALDIRSYALLHGREVGLVRCPHVSPALKQVAEI
jgi:hypothetical protein